MIVASLDAACVCQARMSALLPRSTTAQTERSPSREIAARLGVPPNTIAMRLKLAGVSGSASASSSWCEKRAPAAAASSAPASSSATRGVARR